MEEQIVGTRAWAFWLRNASKVSVPFPSSSVEWKKMYPNETDCPVCHGSNGRSVQAKDGKVYQCICLMPSWRDEQVRLRGMYQSKYEPAELDTIDWRRNEKNSRDLMAAQKAAAHFIESPDTWLVFSGRSGTGKSHFLRAIATRLSPIGLFITATDFERMVFQYVKSGTLDSFVLSVSQAAVLLFDDFGAEYGSDIVKSQIAAIFIARDHQAKDLPTIVSTNLTREQLVAVPRVGSRLLNEDTSIFLPINMEDYRTRMYRQTHVGEVREKW